jgi:hypothetical protein
MQSKPTEDLCVVESEETMTHTFSSTKRITLDKEKDYTYFRVPQTSSQIFSLFLTNIEDAQASSCQETSHVYKEEQIFLFLKNHQEEIL